MTNDKAMNEPRSNPGFSSPPPRYPGSFLLAVREGLAEAGWTPRKWLGPAVECLDQSGHEQVLGLENLYRRLRGEDRTQWPKLIVEMLHNVPVEAVQTTSLSDVADRVLVRLGQPVSRLGDPEKEVWFQPLLGKHFGLTLVVDHPNAMSYVNQGQLAASGEDAATWLERALDNLRQRTPPGALHVVHEESGLLQCQLGDAYDSSRALILDTLLPAQRENGCFVAVPGRDQLLVLPVDKRALEFVAWLRMIAAKTHQTVPYPISPDVFWVQGGAWRPFGIELASEKIVVTPPPEFEAVLRRLAVVIHEETASEDSAVEQPGADDTEPDSAQPHDREPQDGEPQDGEPPAS
jgi:hypothetical protein